MEPRRVGQSVAQSCTTMPTPRLDPQHTVLLVVDVQQRLVSSIHDGDRIVAQTGRLIDGITALGLPILVTEQYPKGLGPIVPELAGRLRGAVCHCEKLKFSACIEPVRRELARLKTRSVLVAGIEAHVCVIQTCVDLIDAGYVTAVAVDATGSRRHGDKAAALERMAQAGVIPTTVESALFELVHEAGGDKFKAILALVK